jgi:hypothetical protein
MDMRPADCRFRLADEGKAYPKSSCTACGRSVATGLGRSCGKVQPEERDRALLLQVASALSDARRLWPARHPATGMIVGIEDDCRQTYDRLTAALDAITARLS